MTACNFTTGVLAVHYLSYYLLITQSVSVRVFVLVQSVDKNELSWNRATLSPGSATPAINFRANDSNLMRRGEERTEIPSRPPSWLRPHREIYSQTSNFMSMVCHHFTTYGFSFPWTEKRRHFFFSSPGKSRRNVFCLPRFQTRKRER